MTLRDRLRAGDIWVEGSRAFNDFLLPPAAFAWPSEKADELGLAVPDRFEAWRDERLEALKRRLRDLASQDQSPIRFASPTWLAISGQPLSADPARSSSASRAARRSGSARAAKFEGATFGRRELLKLAALRNA